MFLQLPPSLHLCFKKLYTHKSGRSSLNGHLPVQNPLCASITLWQAGQEQHWPWIRDQVDLRALGAVRTWRRGINRMVLPWGQGKGQCQLAVWPGGARNQDQKKKMIHVKGSRSSGPALPGLGHPDMLYRAGRVHRLRVASTGPLPGIASSSPLGEGFMRLQA